MKLRTSAGLLLFLIIASLSIMNAWNNWGDLIEKIVSFSTTAIIFFVIIALFDIWRGGNNLKAREIKLIAMAFPTITIVEYIYPAIKYYKQGYESGWLFSLSMDLMIALFVSSVLWSYLKNANNEFC